MAEETLTSHGFLFDRSPARFGELRASNDILFDVAALRARMAEEGYVLLRGYLDKEVVRNARRELLTKLAATGEIDSARALDEAIPAGPADWSPDFVKNLRTGT